MRRTKWLLALLGLALFALTVWGTVEESGAVQVPPSEYGN